MHNANIPEYTELPSSAKLFKSTIIAIVTASLILVTIVLPAEYGIDPTGIGRLTGLKRMGEIKTALAQEAESDTASSATSSLDEPAIPLEATSSSRSDVMSVSLAPNESTEIKITMTKGTAVEYEWTTSSGDAFYDLHGDSSSVNYHIYKKGTSAAEQGTLTAEFDGNHGWYWKNRSSEAITITLKATGAYQDIKEMK